METIELNKTQNNNTLKVESYLPVFTGFYCTIFDTDKSEEFDTYKDYMNAVGVECTKAIEENLKELEIKIKFQEICSPRYYNYDNDSINVEYVLSENSLKLIKEFLEKNINSFETFLKDNYTRYEGFIPFHSNDTKEWFEAIKDMDLKHKLGSILNFYLQEQKYTEDNLFYDIIDEVCQ